MALTKVTGQVIKNTTDVTVGVLTVTNTLAVGGTVSIGGTLTYEDVTNVDAVGLVTARNGIVVGSGITLSKDGDVFFTGIATGNGSGLTALNASNLGSGTVPTARLGSGTASSSTFLRGDSTFATVTTTTINNNADNRVITGSGTADTLEGEANLTFDGSNINQSMSSDGRGLIQTASGNNYIINTINANVTSANYLLGMIQAKWNGTHVADISFNSGSDTSNKDDGKIAFRTSAAQGGISDRMTISSAGLVGIGSASPTHNLDIHASGNPYLKLLRSGYNPVYIGNAAGLGVIETTGDTFFKTGGSERLRITSAGAVGINETSPAAPLHVSKSYTAPTGGIDGNTCLLLSNSGGSAYAGLAIQGTTSGGSYIHFGDTDDINVGNILYDHPSNSMQFITNASERLRITSDGKIGIGVDSPTSALHLKKGGGDCIIELQRSGTNTTGNVGVLNFTASDGHSVASIGAYGDGDNEGGYINFKTTSDASGNSPFNTTSERYRIHSNGKHSWNNTSFPYGETFHFYNGLEGSCASFYQNSSNDHTNVIMRHGRALSGYNGYQMLFKRNDGTNVGSIISGASSTSFNTSSDYRLKENQITIPNAIDKLNKLKPYEFNFKDDPDYKHLGFFAHEVQEVIPNGVAFGEKDEVYTEDAPNESDDYKKGDMRIQSLDYGKLTPLLTAALQEAIVEIESLKAEVAALKSS